MSTKALLHFAVSLLSTSLHIRGECVLALLADLSCELLDLNEELGLCWIVALLFGRSVATHIQSGLCQTQTVLVLCGSHLEILSDSLLASYLRCNLKNTEVSHQGESVLMKISKNISIKIVVQI